MNNAIIKTTPDYEFFVDENGKTLAVNIHTGEISETENVLQVKGSATVTPYEQEKQQEARENRYRYLAQKRQNELRHSRNLPLGKYFFVSASTSLDDFPAEVITKLMYLVTFLSYDNRLMLSQRTQMTYKDLASVLDVSTTTAWKLFKTLTPVIMSDENGGLSVDKRFFKRGKLSKQKYERWYQCYINGVRSLYKSSDVRNHRHIGLLFQLLPYINLEYNILCWNPFETNIENIQCMTLYEYCKQIGYDYNHVDKLLKIYRGIKFDVGKTKERLVSIVGDGVNIFDSKIIINPHVLYNGSNYQNVEALGLFYQE